MVCERIRRRESDGAVRDQDILGGFGLEAPAPVLVVAPHDDDAQIGAGVAIQALQAADCAVHICIVTDGRMGYCEAAERSTILERRRIECERSCQLLGLATPCLHRLELPDATLHRHGGAWHGEDGELAGLTCSLTRILRQQGIALVLGCTTTDIHPDHRLLAAEVPIACFHAASGIWAALGPALPRPPALWHYAVYAPFAGAPHLELLAEEAAWRRKREAITAYASQPAIIAGIEADLDRMQRREYFQHQPFPRLETTAYRSLFDE